MNVTAVDPRFVEKPSRREQAQDAAQRFEQVLVQQLVQEMRRTTSPLGGDGMFGGGAGSGTYEDWFDLSLARHLTHGDGIGIARELMQQWERQGLIPKAGDAKGTDAKHTDAKGKVHVEV